MHVQPGLLNVHLGAIERVHVCGRRLRRTATHSSGAVAHPRDRARDLKQNPRHNNKATLRRRIAAAAANATRRSPLAARRWCGAGAGAARTHAHTHSHIHTHTHARTHAHTRTRFPPRWYCSGAATTVLLKVLLQLSPRMHQVSVLSRLVAKEHDVRKLQDVTLANGARALGCKVTRGGGRRY